MISSMGFIGLSVQQPHSFDNSITKNTAVSTLALREAGGSPGTDPLTLARPAGAAQG
jgi:hypothetical protein